MPIRRITTWPLIRRNRRTPCLHVAHTLGLTQCDKLNMPLCEVRGEIRALWYGNTKAGSRYGRCEVLENHKVQRKNSRFMLQILLLQLRRPRFQNEQLEKLPVQSKTLELCRERWSRRRQASSKRWEFCSLLLRIKEKHLWIHSEFLETGMEENSSPTYCS